MNVRPMTQTKSLWIVTCVSCTIGLLGQLSMAVSDSKVNPAPAFSMPIFWLWVSSPMLGWALCSFFWRHRLVPSIALMLCATVSSVGGWWLLWRDAHWVPTGGRNPILAISGILMSLILYPALHWAVLLASLLLCFLLARYGPKNDRT